MNEWKDPKQPPSSDRDVLIMLNRMVSRGFYSDGKWYKKIGGMGVVDVEPQMWKEI